jgi:hypothetical protein
MGACHHASAPPCTAVPAESASGLDRMTRGRDHTLARTTAEESSTDSAPDWVSKSTREPQYLRLTIEPAEPKLGHQAEVRVRIRNISTKWLWVDYTSGLGPSGPRAGMWLDVVDPRTGKAQEWACSGRSGPSTARRYLLLDPDSEYSFQSDITCFAMPHPGPWRLVAHYRGWLEAPRSAPASDYALWFNGELTSNVLELIVRNPPGD